MSSRQVRSESSSPMPAETLRPVWIRNTPTPPMHLYHCGLVCWRGNTEAIMVTHPTRICLGKNPMTEPSLRRPNMRNARPVRIELRAKATMTVAIAW